MTEPRSAGGSRRPGRRSTARGDRDRALADARAQVRESLEQQAATSDILRVINCSPADVQPVFDAIAEHAGRLCGALFSSVYRFDGELIHMVAQHNYSASALELSRRLFPSRPGRHLFTGRAILDRAVVYVPDVSQDTDHARPDITAIAGFRSVLSVPMLRDGEPIGAITVWHAEIGPFADRHIAMLQTFADQGVIAIENARLFTALQTNNRALAEALEQQTATAEILRLISRSPGDMAEVFDEVLRKAVGVCGADLGLVFRYEQDCYHFAAAHGARREFVEFFAAPFIPGPDTGLGRLAASRQAVQIEDVTAEPLYRRGDPLRRATADLEGIRTWLGVPVVKDGDLLGAIVIYRREVRPFAASHIDTLRTFADQAAIAIENARLFTTLEARNRALTEALEQQTATAEILRIISRSGTDVQPVFDAIAESARRLLRGWGALVVRLEDGRLHAAAVSGGAAGSADALRERFPRSLRRGTHVGDAILDRAVRQVEDIETDETYPSVRENARARGWRAVVAVPMLQDGEPIGALTVSRAEPGPFTAQDVQLLQTFADQAVIAIENARLLTELQRRTQELTRSVEQLTALGAVGQAISSTLDLQTVLSTIVTRATQLARMDAGVIYEYDAQREIFEPRATHQLEAAVVGALVTSPVRKGEGATGRLAELPEPVQLADLQAGRAAGRAREALLAAGYRALLAIPLVREQRLIGGLTVFRKTPGEFPAEVIELLRTFATQSALAIQNARLFQELGQKSRELEAASRHKSEFLANMSHELRTPLNAVIGFSDVLLEGMFGELNDKQTEYLQDILASGTHLLSLINDILDLSKIEAGRMELDLAEIDLRLAIDNALTLVRERATRRGIDLRQAVDERLPPIRADERKIKQVLLNLLSNAIKFTPEGGRVEVRAGATPDGGVEVAVADTGIGIAPEDQAAVFEEFRQVGPAHRKVEGTGLGLALCRKFVELHGGRIWLSSTVNAGSTFTFAIPARAEPPPC